MPCSIPAMRRTRACSNTEGRFDPAIPPTSDIHAPHIGIVLFMIADRRTGRRAVMSHSKTLQRPRAPTRPTLSRILRLTLLAPEIVEAILDGRQPVELQLDDLLQGFPLEWDRQCNVLGGRNATPEKLFARCSEGLRPDRISESGLMR